MSEEEIYNLIYKTSYHTNEELAQILIYKAQHIKTKLPPMLLRVMAGRLRGYDRLRKGEKED